jgi:hypothetical protein
MVLLAVVLFAVYAVEFSGWFKPKTIRIFHTYRNLRAGPVRGNAIQSLRFGLGRKLPLTEINLVKYDAFQTNKYAPSLWHLVTDSNSVPVEDFFYGEYIQGLHPAIKGMRAEELETNVAYLLIVRSKNVSGEHKFELPPPRS